MSFADSPFLELDRQALPERILVVVATAIAVGLPWILPFALVQCAVIAAISVCVVVASSWWNGLIGVHRRVVKAVWDAEGHWWLFNAAGERWGASIHAESRTMPGMTWLQWRSERGRRQMLLCGGLMPAVVARRLSARLRLQPFGKNGSANEETTKTSGVSG